MEFTEDGTGRTDEIDFNSNVKHLFVMEGYAKILTMILFICRSSVIHVKEADPVHQVDKVCLITGYARVQEQCFVNFPCFIVRSFDVVWDKLALVTAGVGKRESGMVSVLCWRLFRMILSNLCKATTHANTVLLTTSACTERTYIMPFWFGTW